MLYILCYIIHRNITTLETDVSGRLFASICQAFTVSRPDIMLPKLLPRLCASVQQLITDDILDDEELDKTLLFHLLLLSFIMESSGTELFKYKSDIEGMLGAALKLNGKKGYGFVSAILRRLLISLVNTYPYENRISEADYDDPNYLAIRDWGICMSRKDIKPSWHCSTEEELSWAKEIFLRVFSEFTIMFDGVSTLSAPNPELNKRLLKHLQILEYSLQGVQYLLPFWDETPLALSETVMDLDSDEFNFGQPKFIILDPKDDGNIKYKYFQMYSNITVYLDSWKSDDTDAYIALVQGLDLLVIPFMEAERRVPLPAPAAKSIASLHNSLFRYITYRNIT